MTEDEKIFWRMERYAKRWPPDWLSRMQVHRLLHDVQATLLLSPVFSDNKAVRVQNESNPVVFFDISIRALDRCVPAGSRLQAVHAVGRY